MIHKEVDVIALIVLLSEQSSSLVMVATWPAEVVDEAVVVEASKSSPDGSLLRCKIISQIFL